MRGAYRLPVVLRKIGVTDARLGIDATRTTGLGNSPGRWFRHFSVVGMGILASANVVISENLDPGVAMRNALMPGGGTIIGTVVHGAIFGEGSRIAGPEEIDAAAGLMRLKTGFSGTFNFLWWGDIDRAGLSQLALADELEGDAPRRLREALARGLRVPQKVTRIDDLWE